MSYINTSDSYEDHEEYANPREIKIEVTKNGFLVCPLSIRLDSSGDPYPNRDPEETLVFERPATLCKWLEDWAMERKKEMK